MEFSNNITPVRLKTSSEIIAEAKASLQSDSIMNTKIVKTKRPYTPKDNHRILFKEKFQGRPSSSINFQKVKFQESGHESGKNFTNISGTKLPSLVNYKSMTSLEKLPEEFVITAERETYSSPALGAESTIPHQNSYVWLPQMNIFVDSNRNDRSSNWIHSKSSKRTLDLVDIYDPVKDNKINEARAELQARQAKDSIQNIVTRINKISLEGCNDDEIIDSLIKLYARLEDEHPMQFTTERRSTKNLILKTLFSLIDSSNETILLHVVQILLLFRVTGANLCTACKLIFKISRFDKNDEYFLERNIIGSFVNCLGLATPDEDSEALIYGYGALKFLMMNGRILECALDNGILQLMALHLKMINLTKTETARFPEQISHVLFQLTGCLRNIANDEQTHVKFVESGTLTAICKTIKLFILDIDLVLNGARITSILSTNEKCCEAIVNENSFHAFLKICKKYPEREDVVVRIMYSIGNILTCVNEAPFQLYSSSENVFQTILKLLRMYLEIDLKLSLEDTYNRSHSLSVEDVLIKIIRVVANMCVDENVGIAFLSSNNFDSKLSELLDCLLIILRRKTIHENEELVISTLSTLNNLSYYSQASFKEPFIEHSLDICEALNSIVLTRHEECVLEVGRVYGNLSRSLVVRKYLLETGSLNYVIDWLDSSNKDLLIITSGVLINVMAEKEARQFLRCTKGIEKLVQNLRNYAEEDWHLASLICQVLWNFGADEEDLFESLGNTQARELLHILIDLIDEDKFFSNCHDRSENVAYRTWEEFSIVATNILEKMARTE